MTRYALQVLGLETMERELREQGKFNTLLSMDESIYTQCGAGALTLMRGAGKHGQ